MRKKNKYNIKPIIQVGLNIFLITYIIQIFFFNSLLIDNVTASSNWKQTSFTDFFNGTRCNLTINNSGDNAELKLDLGNWWSLKDPANKPCAREYPVMAPIYGYDKVILFGGNDDEDNWLNDTWVYDLSDNNWILKTLSVKPTVNYKQAIATVYGTDKIVLYPGQFGETWVYDLSENQWLLKSPKNDPGFKNSPVMATVYNSDQIIMFYSTSGLSNFCDTWIYNLSEDNWTKKTPSLKPSPRSSFAISSIPNTDKILLFGGQHEHEYLDDTWIYDVSENNWTKKEPEGTIPGDRFAHKMAEIFNSDKVVLFGGGAKTGGTWGHYGDTCMYDLSENRWTRKHPPIYPGRRHNHAMTPIYGTDKILFFGGWDFRLIGLNDETWIYEYGTNGTFESQSYDSGSNSSFKTISWDAVIPTETGIRIQIRTATTELKLNSKLFIGPDGTSSTFYTYSPVTIWSGHNGDRWVQYKVYFNTSDMNETPILKNVIISYNRFPKTMLINPENGSAVNNNKPIFKWNFLDNDSYQQIAFQVHIDNEPNFENIEFDSKEQNSINQRWQFPKGTNFKELPDGIWYWRVRTKDDDEDWGPFSDIFTVVIDTSIQKPKELSIIPNTWTSNNSITANWTNPKDLSGIKNGAYYFISKKPPSSQSNGTWIPKKPITISELPEGENYLYIWLKDNVENTNYLKYEKATVKVDTTPPENLSIIINDNAKYTNSEDVELKLIANDLSSGINNMSFNLNEIEWTDWEPFTNIKSITLPLDDGEKKIYFRINDKVGNIAQALGSIILDTTPPNSLSILINNGEKQTNSTEVTLELNAIDETSGINQSSFSFDGKSWSPWETFTSSKILKLPSGDGEKTIYFKVMDNASNVAIPIFTTIYLNTSKPIIDLDNDGYPDNIDAFPNNPTQWLDSDGDNYGDNPNGTNPDYYPNDPTKWKKEGEIPDKKEPSKKVDTNLIWMIIGTIGIIIIIVLILIFFLVIKQKKKRKIEPQTLLTTDQMKPLQPQISQFQQITQHQQPVYPTQQIQIYPIVQYQPIQQYLCSTCGQALTYYSQNNRYYCHHCQKYV